MWKVRLRGIVYGLRASAKVSSINVSEGSDDSHAVEGRLERNRGTLRWASNPVMSVPWMAVHVVQVGQGSGSDPADGHRRRARGELT